MGGIFGGGDSAKIPIKKALPIETAQKVEPRAGEYNIRKKKKRSLATQLLLKEPLIQYEQLGA